jgi:hypothetical protein
MECNRTSFVYHLAEVDLMGEILVDFIKENPNLSEDFFNKSLTPDTVKQNVIRLSVFTDKLAYTLSTESPKMDLVSLLASIGGNVGLFLNVGFFSSCEIFVILIEIIFIFKKIIKNTFYQKLSKQSIEKKEIICLKL